MSLFEVQTLAVDSVAMGLLIGAFFAIVLAFFSRR